MKKWAAVLVILGLLAACKAHALDRPEFDIPLENTTTSGYIKLIWSMESGDADLPGYRFELQQDQSRDFSAPKLIYTGKDFATFLSGLRTGDYYYRVRLTDGDALSEWSEPALVQVRHHSLSLALSLFGLGALVFVCTVGIVVHGHRKLAGKP